jgi:hypothetical protein
VRSLSQFFSLVLTVVKTSSALTFSGVATAGNECVDCVRGIPPFIAVSFS